MPSARTPLFILMAWALGSAPPIAAQSAYESTDLLPQWIHSMLFHDTGPAAIAPPERRVYTNAFIGTWEIKTSAGDLYTYWSDTTRFILRTFKNDSVPMHDVLVDLGTDIRVDLTHLDRSGEADVVIDDFMGRGSVLMISEVDSMPGTGRSGHILGRSVVERQGPISKFIPLPITCWTTTEEPGLFKDLQSWNGGLHHRSPYAELELLCTVRSGLALDLRYTRKGEDTLRVMFSSIERGPAPMSRFDVTPGWVKERRMAWEWNRRIGTLPSWMRAQVSPLPADTAASRKTPVADTSYIPDNRFVGSFTAVAERVKLRSDRFGDDLPDTLNRTFEVNYTYWSDPRRASLMAVSEHGDTTFYLVDLDAKVRLHASRTEMRHTDRLYIETIGAKERPAVEERPYYQKDLRSTGETQHILGAKCEEYALLEQPPSATFPRESFWFSDIMTHPIDDMENWGGNVPERFMVLSFLSIPGMPFAFLSPWLRITSIQMGVVEPPRYDLTRIEPVDTRVE